MRLLVNRRFCYSIGTLVGVEIPGNNSVEATADEGVSVSMVGFKVWMRVSIGTISGISDNPGKYPGTIDSERCLICI